MDMKGYAWIGESLLNHDKWQLKLLCFVVVVGSFQLLYGLQWDRVAQHFTNEKKVSRKWSDSVHLLPFQLNKNNTTTHRVLIVKIQNQISIKLSYNIYYKTHHNYTWDQQSINSSKLVQCLTITITVALFLSLYYVQASIPLHYRTSQNQSQLSQF